MVRLACGYDKLLPTTTPKQTTSQAQKLLQEAPKHTQAKPKQGKGD
ncbi:hypothetical protein ACT3N8_10430 [Psychrobacter aquimaris]